MCQHLNVLVYMSASWCVVIYVGIWTSQHICLHKNKCVDIYTDTPRFWRICQNIELWAHSTSCDEYANIYVNTFILVLADMMTYSNADIYASTLKCRYILLVMENMPTRMPTHLFLWWQICWYVQLPTYMPTHQDADIYANTLRCRHILLVVRNMPTYMSTHFFRVLANMQTYSQMPTYMSTY